MKVEHDPWYVYDNNKTLDTPNLLFVKMVSCTCLFTLFIKTEITGWKWDLKAVIKPFRAFVCEFVFITQQQISARSSKTITW